MQELSGFETEVLDKLIGTQSFGELSDLQIGVNECLNLEKSKLIASGQINESDFNALVTHTSKNISQFLMSNHFYKGERIGMYFLTEKGKQLRKQGSFQKYMDWDKMKDQELLEDIRAIETQGYVKKEQPNIVRANNKSVGGEKKSNITRYIIIIVVIIAACLVGKYAKFK